MSDESCDKCGGHFGPGTVEDPLSGVMGGRPWRYCDCPAGKAAAQIDYEKYVAGREVRDPHRACNERILKLEEELKQCARAVNAPYLDPETECLSAFLENWARRSDELSGLNVVRAKLDEALQVLREVYSLYENGTDCYESNFSGETGAYLGNAIDLRGVLEGRIQTLLSEENVS